MLWQYCTDEPAAYTDDTTTDFSQLNATKSFNLKAKIASQTGTYNTEDVEKMVPLEYLSNFWRILGMSL